MCLFVHGTLVLLTASAYDEHDQAERELVIAQTCTLVLRSTVATSALDYVASSLLLRLFGLDRIRCVFRRPNSRFARILSCRRRKLRVLRSDIFKRRLHHSRKVQPSYPYYLDCEQQSAFNLPSL